MVARPTILYDASVNAHRPFVNGPGADVPDPVGHPEGYTAATTPPAASVVGDHWTNTDTVAVSGVPAGFTARWNGHVWQPERIPVWTIANAAPTTPALGDYWVNTAGFPVSGVPGGMYAIWDGSSWRLNTPDEGYTASIVAPVNPLIGDHWKNMSGGIVSGVPSGFTARWNGTIWDYIPAATGTQYGIVQLSTGAEWSGDSTGNNDVDAATPLHVKNAILDRVEKYYAQATEPTTKNVGDRWLNSSGATVAGVAAGYTGVWTGSFWDTTVETLANTHTPTSRTLTAAGLVTGGGDLNADRTFTVTAATAAETAAMARADVAVTPASLTQFRNDLYIAILAAPPSTLDTLQEIATALGNDPNFATTITTLIGTKAPLSRNLTAAGLVTGGGDLNADRTFTVTASTNAQATTGTDTTTAMTPASTRASYVPIAGGTYTGNVSISNGTDQLQLHADGHIELRRSGGAYADFTYDGSSDFNARIWSDAADGLLFMHDNGKYFRLRRTGAMEFWGTGVGSPGQVLQTNGDAPPTWVNITSPTVSPGSVV